MFNINAKQLKEVRSAEGNTVFLELEVVGRLFAGARLSWWLSRDVVESQLLGRGVRRGNSTRNHALSGCARLIRLLSRCLLSATTRDAFAASQGPTWRCAAAKDGV